MDLSDGVIRGVDDRGNGDGNGMSFGDNFHFDVTASGREWFATMLRLAFHACPGGKATHFSLSPHKLVLFWHEDHNATALPYPMTVDAATEFAWNWLLDADRGEQPDHDGSNGEGWRIRNGSWARVDCTAYGFVSIEPWWMMYGK